MVNINKVDSLEQKFKIKVPYSEVEKKIEENYIELSKSLKLPGFRPGKVPIAFVKSKYEKEVKSKVTEKIIQEEGNKSFESKGFRLAAQPKVKLLSNIDNKNDFLTLKGHKSWVKNITVNQKNKILYSVSEDASFRYWYLDQSALENQLKK